MSSSSSSSKVVSSLSRAASATGGVLERARLWRVSGERDLGWEIEGGSRTRERWSESSGVGATL